MREGERTRERERRTDRQTDNDRQANRQTKREAETQREEWGRRGEREDLERSKLRERERERKGERYMKRQRKIPEDFFFFGLVDFSTSSSTTRRTGPKTERLTISRAATHETELGDHDFYLSRSHYTDTDPTSRERAASAGIEPGT